MSKINYPKIEEYNKKNSFYYYIENYIREFKNKKDKIELSHLCAKDIIELTKKDKGLYQNCVKCLELIELWLKDENSINIQELKEIASSIYNPCTLIEFSSFSHNSINSIYYSAYSIYYSISFINSVSYSAYSIYYANRAKPELLPYIQKLIQMYLRKEKQFNIKEHNNSEYEKIIKIILKNDYLNLKEIDKMQAKDIINEYYDIEIDCFDFIAYKTIQREFI